ncbi:sulfate adenylyltransferase subunit CysD [bacterium]|nr:sulfate adenylyltransferase subunit CysD [bacterium]
MDFHLQQLEQKSIYILRETKARFKNPAMLWSMGKDSTLMLYLCKRAFFGKLPFPAIHLDSGHDFPESYQFRDKIVKEWGVNLIIGKVKHEKDGISGTTEGLNKAEALRKLLAEYKFDALVVSIRRDEHGIRAKERYFSPRDKDFHWNFKNQPPEIFNYISEFKDASHVRVHPLLHWTELDVWEYTREKNIPFNSLYLAKNGKRYRSLGYKEVTHPISSNADTIDKIIEEVKTSQIEERSGRAMEKEKEYVMERLRQLGYF